jgi:lipoyl(octanoyl) transferase
MDLMPFSWINPCGYEGLATVDMRSLGINAAAAEVQARLAERLTELLSN